MKEEKEFYLYVHTNKINNKRYVGITCQNPRTRWGSNGNGYKKSPLFYRAIQKYGWENFKHEIIMENLSKESAKNKEIETIKKYMSNDRKYGYNISKGGGGGFDVEIKKENIEKIKNKLMIKIVQLDDGANLIKEWDGLVEASKYYKVESSAICQCCKGNKRKIAGYNWFYKKDYDTMNKISLLEEIDARNHIKPKRIIQFDEHGNYIKCFESYNEIEKTLNFKNTHIYKSCNNEVKAYGYIWIYEKDYLEKYNKNISKFVEKVNEYKIKVVQITKGGEFIKEHDSLIDASKYINSNNYNIWQCCNDRVRYVNNFIFVYSKKYYELVENNKLDEYLIYKNEYKNKEKDYVEILQFDKNGNLLKEWNSFLEIEKNFNINRNSIKQCCSHKIKTSCGFIWVYKKEYEEIGIDINSHKAKDNSRTIKKRIIQLGRDYNVIKIWNSPAEAQNKGKYTSYKICLCCRLKQKTHKGFIWMYYEDFIASGYEMNENFIERKGE